MMSTGEQVSDQAICAFLPLSAPLPRNLNLIRLAIDRQNGRPQGEHLPHSCGSKPVALSDRRGALAGCFRDDEQLSPLTAKTHVSRILMKLGARDRVQLVVIAYQAGNPRRAAIP
jgi:Bacterial regulatory proteins, luxR family